METKMTPGQVIDAVRVMEPQDQELVVRMLSVFVKGVAAVQVATATVSESTNGKRKTASGRRGRPRTKSALYLACESGIAPLKELWQRRLTLGDPTCPSNEEEGIQDTFTRLNKSSRASDSRHQVYKEYADGKWGLAIYPKPQLVPPDSGVA